MKFNEFGRIRILITNNDERYIVNLVERVTRVSVETVAIVNGLPPIN